VRRILLHGKKGQRPLKEKGVLRDAAPATNVSLRGERKRRKHGGEMLTEKKGGGRHGLPLLFRRGAGLARKCRSRTKKGKKEHGCDLKDKFAKKSGEDGKGGGGRGKGGGVAPPVKRRDRLKGDEIARL